MPYQTSAGGGSCVLGGGPAGDVDMPFAQAERGNSRNIHGRGHVLGGQPEGVLEQYRRPVPVRQPVSAAITWRRVSASTAAPSGPGPAAGTCTGWPGACGLRRTSTWHAVRPEPRGSSRLRPVRQEN